MLCKNYYLILFLVLFHFQNFSQSIKEKKYFHLPSTITYTSNLSASYVNYKNWKYNGYNNFAFLARENLNYDTLGAKLETHLRFNGELGYMKFVDSTWYKNNDYLDLSAEIVKTKTKLITNVFTLYFNSQFLSNYEMYYNDLGIYSKRWTGGFGNPMYLDIGYGSEIRFWKTCRINLTYVTLRTNVIPALDMEKVNSENDFLYKKSLITSEYGLGIQTYIRHNFCERIRWENYSRCFANAINRNRIDLDFRNKIIIKVLKYMDLILDTRIRYMPLPPYKFQFRNELMLSFTIEKI
jgi:hypothetical protein